MVAVCFAKTSNQRWWRNVFRVHRLIRMEPNPRKCNFERACISARFLEMMVDNTFSVVIPVGAVSSYETDQTKAPSDENKTHTLNEAFLL